MELTTNEIAMLADGLAEADPVTTTYLRDLQRRANAVARKSGYGWATTIILDPNRPARVIDHTDYGYRKLTTGEYVSNAYRANFGWKNTYYQSALTTVTMQA